MQILTIHEELEIEEDIPDEQEDILRSFDKSIIQELLEEPDVDFQSFRANGLVSPVTFSGGLQYRGWYNLKDGRSRWCPRQSRYLGRKGKHKGLDIFSDEKTVVNAIIDGRIQYNPRGAQLGGWGNHIYLYFKKTGKVYVAVYSHLDASSKFSGVKNVDAGDQIGFVGCTGNAGKNGVCDRMHSCQLADGSSFTPISDHLHFELMEADTAKRVDPISFFPWKIEYATTNVCSICPQNRQDGGEKN